MLSRKNAAILFFFASGLLWLACDDGLPDERQKTIDEIEQRAAQNPRQAEVNFGYIHHFEENSAPSSSGSLTVSVEERQIELTEIALVTSALELHRCSITNELTGLSPTRHSPLEWLIPTAHAHVPSSATRQGSPYVEDLLGPPESARMSGGIAPPFGDYCELHIILAPADDDVINLTNIAPETIEHHTILIRGKWRGADTPWRDFIWTDDRRESIAVELYDPHSGESPLSLMSAGSQTLLLVDKTIHRAALDSIEIGEDGPDFDRFINDLTDTFSVYRF